ncbi:MAG TPA: TetR family transcriptional regulator, partial [Vicinamibacterales bacterium]
MPPRKDVTTLSTRDAVFQAAASLFSAKGFDGVSVDDIAAGASVNKAMIYYHFNDKLTLYRAVVADMLSAVGARVASIAEAPIAPAGKLDRFIEQFVRLADERPWFPTLMLREIAEGALHFDTEILSRMRNVFLAFMRLLSEGQEQGVFREVNPVLAY